MVALLGEMRGTCGDRVSDDWSQGSEGELRLDLDEIGIENEAVLSDNVFTPSMVKDAQWKPCREVTCDGE